MMLDLAMESTKQTMAELVTLGDLFASWKDVFDETAEEVEDEN